MSPDEKLLVTAPVHGSTCYIWDVESGVVVKEFGRMTRTFKSVLFSPDGKSIIAVCGRDSVIWDVNSGKELYELDKLKMVNSASFSPDGKQLVVAQDKATRILNWASIGDWSSATEPKPVDTAPDIVFVIPQAGASHGVSLSGSEIHPSSDLGAVQELNQITSQILSASFSPDGQKIITTGSDGVAVIWNASSGKKLLAFGDFFDDKQVAKGSFSPDGKCVVTANIKGIAKIWDSNSGKELRRLEGHDGPLNFATFSPDGTKVVTTGEDRTARIWAADTGKELLVLKGHKGAVYSAAFSPDGRKIATASGDEFVRIWDADAGNELETLEGHADLVRSVAFSPDGKKIISASNDKTARIWNADSGKEIQRLKGHMGLVRSALFSSDGTKIVTASWDGTAWVWDVESGEVLHRLEAGKTQYGVRYGGFGLQGDFGIMDDETWRVWGEKQKDTFGEIVSASFSPDGKKILTACLGKTNVQIWSLSAIERIEMEKKRKREK